MSLQCHNIDNCHIIRYDTVTTIAHEDFGVNGLFPIYASQADRRTQSMEEKPLEMSSFVTIFSANHGYKGLEMVLQVRSGTQAVIDGITTRL